MTQDEGLKWGVIAAAAIGFLVILFFALSSDEDVEGRSWVVRSLGGSGSSVAPIDGTVISATFEDGTVSGIAGCNNYFAGYELDGDSITVGPAGSTLMFCGEPEGVMEQEQAYLALLQSADSVDVDGDTLTLSSGGSVVLTYAEAETGS